MKPIELPLPQKTGGKPVMEALNERQTRRSFTSETLSHSQLSNLLWAAFGINRPEEHKRTAPSARNTQEVDIYVVLETGVFLYKPAENLLEPLVAGDFRKNMGRQEFVGTAAVVLVFVADYTKLSTQLSKERKAFYTGTSVGYISQNVYLYAASENMATVAIGSFNEDEILKIIPLKDTQKILLTQAFGFHKQ